MRTMTIIIAALLAGCSGADDTEPTDGPEAPVEAPADPEAKAFAECYEEGAETHEEAEDCVDDKLGRISMGGGR